MLPFESTESAKLLAIIRDVAKGATKKEVDAALKLSRRRKPKGMDAVSSGTQERYRGRQTEIVREALGKQFPAAIADGVEMPIAPINWLRLLARLDAGVYVMQSDRWLEERGAETKTVDASSPPKVSASNKWKRIGNDDPRHDLWQWALKKARFHVTMAECERHALLPPGTAFGHVVWVMPPGDDVGYPRIDLYWPHDVEVLCHPDAPSSWEHAVMVALRQAPRDDSGADWYRIYSRAAPDTIDGEWGPWHFVECSTGGDQAGRTAEPVKYEGKLLPIFRVALSDPEGSVFTNEDADLLDVVDDLNVRRSNESHVVNLQGHDQLWISGTTEAGTKKGGADTIIQVPPGERLEVVSHNPALSEMIASRLHATKETAISRTSPPEAYSTEPGPPLSAASKRISNIAHETRIAEQMMLMQVIEEEGPLPILLDVMRTFHDEAKALLAGVRARMAPRKPPIVEDMTQRWMRLDAQVKSGAITLARACVEAELYPNEEEAQDAIDKIKESADAPKPAPAPGAPEKPEGEPDDAPANDDEDEVP